MYKKEDNEIINMNADEFEMFEEFIESSQEPNLKLKELLSRKRPWEDEEK